MSETSKKNTKRGKQGLTFCRSGHKAVHLVRTNACPDCGFCIRGANHENGQHHKGGKEGRLRVK